MSSTDLDTDVESPATDARPMRKDAARNRKLLIEAAREVFARRGMEASLDDVAKHAGVGVGTAYRHFANKYDLATAIVQDVVDSIIAEAERAAEADDPWAGLVGFLESVLTMQARDRCLREVMTGVHDPSKAERINDKLLPPIGRLIARAQQAGQMRSDAAQSDVGFVFTMLCGVADLAGDVTPELWRRYLPTLLAGLRPDGPPMCGTPLTDEQFQDASLAQHARTVRAVHAAGTA